MKSSYRWVILAVFMFITLSVEIQWLTHAAVVRPAGVFYKGQYNAESLFNIDFLAISYMVMFLVFSFPASYLIDSRGIRKALTLGAAIAALSALGKAIFAADFTGVLISQLGLAIAQPLILNAVTAVTVRWFPLSERGLAAGLSVLAQYIGIIIAMLVTPLIVGSDPNLPGYGEGFGKMLWIYGAVTIVASVLVVIFIREHPVDFVPEPETRRQEFMKGVVHILRNRDMQITLFLFLIGLGIFNAISSMTDSISEKAGVEDSDGMIGGLMLIGGIAGALIIPALSDRFRKRKLFLVLCIAGMIPGVSGLAFGGSLHLDPDSTYNLLLASAFVLGFFVMSAGPVGFQYAAEVSLPAPESASQGMLLWIGQLSGMVFTAGMSSDNTGHLQDYMHVFAVLTLISLFAVILLKESPVIRNQTGT